MIDYTKAAVNKIIADFKSFFNIFQIYSYRVFLIGKIKMNYEKLKSFYT